MTAVLQVKDLVLEFATRHGPLRALDGVSLHIGPGEVLGVVGESGAGKSLTGAAVIGLLESSGRVTGGEIWFQGQRIDNLPPSAMQKLRGRHIGAVFQDPLTALNPLMTVGQQLVQTILTHRPMQRSQAQQEATTLLTETGIADAAVRMGQYPHQFSGGMRQRAVIALALAAQPQLIIADEPTTALDVSIQAQIIALLRRLCVDRGVSVMLITHDMGVIAQTCDRVAVMYAGRVVEQGPVQSVIHHSRHPYTQGLMACIPTVQTAPAQAAAPGSPPASVIGREGASIETSTEMDSLVQKTGRAPRLSQIDGAMPRLTAMPVGCASHPRCPQAQPQCRQAAPAMQTLGDQQVACWLVADGSAVSPQSDLQQAERKSTELGSVEAAAVVPQWASAQADGAAVVSSVSPQSIQPLLQVQGLSQIFDVSGPRLQRWLAGQPRQLLHAVREVGFELRRGQTLGLVGESGCGKSSLARVLVGLAQPAAGQVRFDGMDVHAVLQGPRPAAQALRRRIQKIFQDPYASLNPRWRVDAIVAEPLRTNGSNGALTDEAAIERRVAQLLTQVGLSPQDGRKYPHQFSGGQRQRISIARALACEPEFLVLDEPTSALDVSVQAQVLNLMQDLQAQHGLTYLFISHNLAVVQHMSDWVGVMYLGRLVELADKHQIFQSPRHPYTQMLLASVASLQPKPATPAAGLAADASPSPSDPRGATPPWVPTTSPVATEAPEAKPLMGEVPSPIKPPSGCAFHPRCPKAQAVCRTQVPVWRGDERGGWVACHC